VKTSSLLSHQLFLSMFPSWSEEHCHVYGVTMKGPNK
jgi:hypothetical protein